MIGGVAVLLALAGLWWWSPWKSASTFAQNAFIEEVAALPAEEQVARVVAKLKELNPGFDGHETHKIEDDAVVELKLLATRLTDISPVAALRQLRLFLCNANPQSRSQLADISPLRGLPLTNLELNETEVGDLSPLAGMPLIYLHLHCPKVKDLSPLKGMKLTRLCCGTTHVTDLSPLRGMKLEWFVCDSSLFKSSENLAVLRAMTTLNTICHKPAAQFWKDLDSGKIAGAQPVSSDQERTAAESADADWQNAVNLLPLMDPQKDALCGQWTIANGELTASDARVLQKIQPAYRPPSEYDFNVCFTVKNGVGNVAIGLSAAGRPFVLYMKHFPDCHVLGFEAINGKPIRGGPTETRMPFLENGRRYSATVQVRKDGLKAFLDGKLMTSWKTDFHDMSSWPVWKFRDAEALGVGCEFTHTVYHSLKVLEITGKGTVTRGAPDASASAVQGKVIDLLAQVDVNRDVVRGEWEKTADGSLQNKKVKDQTAVAEFDYKPQAEYDFEIEFTPQDGGDIGQRFALPDRSLLWRMSGITYFGPELDHLKATDSARTEARKWAPRLIPGRRYRCVVEVRKNSLRAVLDGVEVVKFSGDLKRLTVDEDYWFKLRDPQHLGVFAANRSTVSFHKITVREVTDKGAFTRGTPAGQTVSAVPADGAWQNAINLLPLIDPEKDAVGEAKWTRVAEGLMSDIGFFSRVEIPYQPPAEYDFRIVFTQMQKKMDANGKPYQSGDMFQVLQKDGCQFHWYMDRHGAWFAFDAVGGKPFDHNPTSVRKEENLQLRRRYTSTVSVRKDSVKAFLDGQRITEWRPEFGELNDGLFGLRNKTVLGIGACNVQTLFHSIEVREVNGKGTFTRGMH